MIKKIPKHNTWGQCLEKLNEVIDVVNAILAQQDEYKRIYDEDVISMLTPEDPYAEQRKWIGKLCRFWDYDGEGKCFNILKEIGNPNTIQVWKNGAFRTSNGYWYKHCEPVKPDEDIIYKGGNNEL